MTVPLQDLPDDLDRSEFAATVRALNARTGRDVSVVLEAKSKSHRAAFDRRTGQILVSRLVLDEPLDVQRGSAAHEFAHALEGPRRELPVPFVVGGMVVSAAVAFGMSLFVDAAGLLVPLVLALELPWFWLINTPQRHRERQADLVAAQLVGREPVVALLSAIARWETSGGWLYRWGLVVGRALGLHAHPSPARRRAYVTAHPATAD